MWTGDVPASATDRAGLRADLGLAWSSSQIRQSCPPVPYLLLARQTGSTTAAADPVHFHLTNLFLCFCELKNSETEKHEGFAKPSCCLPHQPEHQREHQREPSLARQEVFTPLEVALY